MAQGVIPRLACRGAALTIFDLLRGGDEIEEDEIVFDRLIMHVIAAGAEIERSAERQDAMLAMSEIFARFIRRALVVDHDDLIVRVARLGDDAGDAAGEKVDPVAGRDDDRDPFRLPQFTFYPVGVRLPVHRHMAAFAAPLEMALDGVPAGFERLRFAPDVVGGGGFAGASDRGFAADDECA